MKGLILDTSTSDGYIILSEKQQPIVFERIATKNNNIAFSLIPTIDKILKKAKTPLSSIQYIAIGIGPGSFTGIRIGATAALSIRYAQSIPVITYCSLEGFLPPTDISSFFTVYDANMGGIYVVEGTKTGSIVEFTAPKQMSLNQAIKALPTDSYIITPHKTSLQPKLPSTMTLITSSPDASWISSLTYNKFLKKEFTNNTSIKLLYLKNIKHY